LEDVIRLEPTAVDAHLVLIGIAMQEREYEVARNSAIRALGSNPDNLALLSARGRAELAMENTQMAAELARVVLQKDPNNVQARDVLVTAALTSADRSLLEEARTLVESAAGRDPTNENLLIARARVLVAMELPETAIPQLEAYCQTEEGSSNVPAIVTLADLYRLAGDMDKSKERIEQAERMDPNSQTVVHARFLWLVSQKRFDELAEISSTYISAKDQNPTTLVNAASILAALDSMELKKEGIKLFEHALTLSPTSMNARIGRASTLYQTGNAERAEKLYQELFEQYPNDTRIINDLAWILQEHYQRYPAALKLADRGLALAPNDLHLLDTRGAILSKLAGRVAEARSDFQKLVALSPPDTRRKAKALLQLARVCTKLNDLVQAKQHLNNALAIDQKIDVFTTDERSEIKTILQK
ncbi:MAG: tetratricopeptide repeat protein, partial [Planctomycetes bacterium]|nr:tetratricopeptide repeat protein [Planctomycetota bacterium]